MLNGPMMGLLGDVPNRTGARRDAGRRVRTAVMVRLAKNVLHLTSRRLASGAILTIHWAFRRTGFGPETVVKTITQLHVRPSMIMRCEKNVPGAFYTTGECLACGAPESMAPELLAPLDDTNYETFFFEAASDAGRNRTCVPGYRSLLC